MFEKTGCAVQPQKVRGAKEPNLVCTLAGESSSVIVIGAHFDAVKAGDGAADNWSGASLLPTLYESLASEPRQHTFVFVGFAAEEVGLMGSKQFVKKMTKEERERVAAMINLDTLGLGPVKVWLSKSDEQLVADLVTIAQALKTPIAAVNADDAGSSDFQPFRAKKIPCLVVHSVTSENYPILHSPRDNLDAIDFDQYYQTYKLLATYLAYIDGKQKPAD